MSRIGFGDDGSALIKKLPGIGSLKQGTMSRPEAMKAAFACP
jgi:hypothetical protein